MDQTQDQSKLAWNRAFQLVRIQIQQLHGRQVSDPCRNLALDFVVLHGQLSQGCEPGNEFGHGGGREGVIGGVQVPQQGEVAQRRRQRSLQLIPRNVQMRELDQLVQRRRHESIQLVFMHRQESQLRVLLLQRWDDARELVAVQIHDHEGVVRTEEISGEILREVVVADVEFDDCLSPVLDEVVVELAVEAVVFEVEVFEVWHHAVELVDIACEAVVVETEINHLGQGFVRDCAVHVIVAKSESRELGE
mmetsp:Transcript_5073/g.13553  ORF Transcript_5073/g.13553 Transcript_5073/m.13553 type:complete len:249 (+) Transcript_5073:1891-2637(+)